MFEDLTNKMKKLDVTDLALIKWSAVVAGIIIIKLIPQLLQISYLVLIIVLIALAAKPVYKFFM